MSLGIPNKSFLHSPRNPVGLVRNENTRFSIGEPLKNNDKVVSIVGNNSDLKPVKIEQNDPATTNLPFRKTLSQKSFDKRKYSDESLRRNSVPEKSKNHYAKYPDKKEKRNSILKIFRSNKKKSSNDSLPRESLISLTPECEVKCTIVDDTYDKNNTKVRSVGKKHVKSMVISKPKDFVHVASASNVAINKENSESNDLIDEKWVQTIADIFNKYSKMPEKVEVNSNNINDKSKDTPDKPVRENQSFLWSPKSVSILEDNRAKSPDTLEGEGHVQESDIYQETESIYDDICSRRRFEKSSKVAQQDSYDYVANRDSSTMLDNDFYLSINNHDVEDKDTIYDDICLPYEKRVNSLYSQSEWDDFAKYFKNHSPMDSEKPKGSKESKSNKKSNGPLRKLNLMKQQPKKCQVAVSLGKGTVLVIRGDDMELQKDQEFLPRKTQGLVQIRIIDLNEIVDVQETSCYVLEDENTYEVLYPPAERNERVNTDWDWDDEQSSNGNVEDSVSCASNCSLPSSKNTSVERSKNLISKTWNLTKDSESNETHSIKNNYGSNVFLKRKKNSIRHSVMVNEEPLYQIYSNAITQEYDEESNDFQEYEQIEDLLRPAVRTESDRRIVAKSGCRTFWSQTDEVTSGGWLEKLTPGERVVQEAKFEIITSEASYLNSLEVLKREFIEDEGLKRILTDKQKDNIFGEVLNILSLSDKFLNDLESIWQKDPMMSGLLDVCLKHSTNWNMSYINYCYNQIETDITLKELRDRNGPRYLDVIANIESRAACQSLPFHSFLLLPLQRITRFPLLVDAVLTKLPPDHEEKLLWEYLLSSLNEIVVKCNEATKNAAEKAELAVLEKKLSYPQGMELISWKDRHLIKSGKLTRLSPKTDIDYILTFKKKFSNTPVFLLVLTDYIIISKVKTNGQEDKYTVLEVCKKNLIEVEAIDKPTFFNDCNIMVLTLLENHQGRQVEYFLKCGSDTERQRWMEAIVPSKSNDVGEIMYETWDCPQYVAIKPYTASQPDELSLLPGDVINVLRKTHDDWCHGEQLLNGAQGWFPKEFAREVVSEHVRARNLKQRHRFLALNKKPANGRLLSPR